MEIGDLVQQKHVLIHMEEGIPRKNGIIVDIDPLARAFPSSMDVDESTNVPEIVVMLPNGVLWHAGSIYWEVIS